MDENRPAKGFAQKEVPVNSEYPRDHRLPFWLFRHRDLIDSLHGARPVGQEALINILNHIHFVEGCVFVHLRDPEYQESIFVKARPEPSAGHRLTCQWDQARLPNPVLETYRFSHLVIEEGRSLIFVPAILKEMDGDRLIVELPRISHAVAQRQVRRYVSKDIRAEIFQDGLNASGELLDFSPLSFGIRIKPSSSHSFHWFNLDLPVMLQLGYDKTIFYFGLCKRVRQKKPSHDNVIVLAPSYQQIQRLKSERVRNPRQRLLPPPTLIFHHPLWGKKVQLDVSDISTSGFSVFENADDGILLTGMVIPKLRIDFAGTLQVECTAQVIYRADAQDKNVRCGLAILDMGINDYSRLSHILSRAMDPRAYISSEVDTDTLWELFFKAGFIYPEKYRLIQSHKEKLKDTFRKLYHNKPEIARHFTYQRNGFIYGHISMVRAYEKTWMIHHHSSRPVKETPAGFKVLKQVMHCLKDMHRLPSANMDFVMCYFRPESKFPKHVFGGFAKALKDPGGCSTDLFSYLLYPGSSLGTRLPKGWSLEPCSSLHTWELEQFYSHHSGGLLLDILKLDKEGAGSAKLEELYAKFGFMRKWRAYSLVHRGRLTAVLIVDQSDLGLNLSELLNSIKILALHPEGPPWDILSMAIGQFTPLYGMHRIPVLVYPNEYVAEKNIPWEKQYQLWILNVLYGTKYMAYMQERFGIANE